MFRTLIAVAAASLSLPLHAETLAVRGDRLFVTVDVAGESVEALLDSGAEMTVFDRVTAERLDIGSGTKVEARGTGATTTSAELIENVNVRTLGQDIDLPVVAVMDLSDVGTRLIGGPLPMVLGRDVFDAGLLAVDIEGGRIEFVSDDGVPTGERLILTPAHGIETIPVAFGPDMIVAADFDLGNGSDLLISSELASSLGLSPVGVEPGGGIGGAVGRPVVYVPELTIAGKHFHDVRAQISESMQTAANVGVKLLRNFRILTDFPNRQVWLAPREQP